MHQKQVALARYVRISVRAALILISPLVLLSNRNFGNPPVAPLPGETPPDWRRAHELSEEKQLRLSVVEYARQFQGLPYIWGAKKPFKGFDCSGFTQFVWNRYDADLPEGAAGQFDSTANSIPLDQARAGDLVFFRENPRHQVTHVALVVEADSSQLRVLHSVTSRGVIEEDLLQNPYWKPKIDEIKEVRLK